MVQFVLLTDQETGERILCNMALVVCIRAQPKWAGTGTGTWLELLNGETLGVQEDLQAVLAVVHP